VTAPRERLSLAQARRVALAAQGFASARPAEVTTRAMLGMVDRLGVVQIDSVNVVSRAHYLPLFSRLGPYDRDRFDQASWRAPRRLFEYWGHEASLLPVELQPLFRWRMARAHDEAWGGMRRIATEQPELVARVLEDVRAHGPISAAQLSADEQPKRTGPWWDWSDVKRAIEYLFWSGEVTSARRRGFERLYDLPERVLPKAVFEAPTPSEADAQRELVRRSAVALGVASAKDLRDYYRLPVAGFKERLAELVEAGAISEVAVEGWKGPAYLAAGARLPRRIDARALLVPFDPIVWERDRAERLYGFRYRIEIYVPAPQRVHGYYVLPFLLGDRLVARVDLKADRAGSTLLVQSAHAEDHAPAETAAELADELRLMAGWLGLERVEARDRGDLAPALRRALS
jgi:uncharacterized protein